MATIRMIPPNAGGTLVVRGRTYTAAAGASIDVPDFDAGVLEANGWSISAAGGVGTTANRPTNLGKKDRGLQFHDATLAKNILWNGQTWIDPTNGNAV